MNRLAICAGGDDHHRHGSKCLPLLVRVLPPAPKGWKWGYGRAGAGWGLWLERTARSTTRWYVVGLPTTSTLGQLAAIVEAFVAGHRGKIDGLP